MRIAIDATPLLLRSAGVKNHLYHWLTALRRCSGPHRIAAFPWVGATGPLDHERSVLGAWPTFWRLGLLYALNAPANPGLDILASRADLFHATNQLRRPIRRARLTATIHDLTALTRPDLHTAANVQADSGFADRVLKRAAGLIAVSEHTRQDAIRLLGIPPEKIETIHPGIDERFFHAVAEPPERPYVLYLGTIEPRKNVDRLLDAWAALKPSLREEFELVIAGPAGWRAGPTLARLASRPPGVRYLGYVPETSLPGLTAGATAFAYPSQYEGFGFPVAQAMAAGVPVLTSNLSSLPEVVGDAALLVDANSEREIAAALSRLLESAELRARLSAAGREQARRFRWDRCARASIAFFERVAGV
jgi:alpha-1,3-rhamnosyl/mannosyltransferase